MSRKKKEPTKDFLVVPKDLVTTPFFTVTPVENRSFVAGNKQFDFNMPLTIDHATALYNILSFKDPLSDKTEINFTLWDLCNRMYASDSGQNLTKTKDLLNQLTAAQIKISNPATRKWKIVRILESITIEGDIKKNELDEITSAKIKGVKIHEEFQKILLEMAELTGINLKEYNSIGSKIAKAIYNYIPSRAHFHDKETPYEISLATLFSQLAIQGYNTKSERKKAITQNKSSVISQINGRKVSSGKLYVKLSETKDKKDHKLVAWTEKKTIPEWANSTIDNYERDLLETSNIEIPKIERYLKKAKFLLGKDHFDEILAEEKNKVLEGKEATKNSTARLLDTLKREIGEERPSTHTQPNLL